MAKMKVGLVGCGNIGSDLCIALQKGDIPAEIVALTDVEPARAEALKREYGLDSVIGDIESTASRADFIIECAVAAVVPEVIAAAIRHRRECLVLSLGALVNDPTLLETAKANGVQVRMPSGALCGLDGVRAAREAGLESVTITSTKPPKGLTGAPYLIANGIDVESFTTPTVVFEGNALDAVKAFPKNVNVAAALSFAGIGPERTRVRVVADPTSNVNSHEIVAEGAFGRLRAVTENVPSPRNPKTSYLASLSACAELRAAALAFQSRLQGF